jgi:phosphate transport system protein
MHNESHYEKSLQRDIELLRQKVLEMAMLDEGGLRNAIDALMNKDRQLAYTVILRDRCVDEMEIELDRLCLEFLVRQQPVAGHLRFVFATIKIIRELERIGDYAESIARQVLNIMPISPIPPLDDFQALAEVSISMFHDCVQAFLSKDVEWARRLMVKEDIADEMRNSINARLIKQQEEGLLALDALAPLMTVARRLERTTDQAKNICEEVVYMSTGEFIKHKRSEAFRILFVDSTNSSLSQMAEAIGRARSMERFAFSSAGLAPAGQLDPMLPQFLAGKEIGLEGQHPKSFIEFLDNVPVDIIVALNTKVRKLIPANHSNSIVFEWLIADPCQMSGTAAEILGGYEQAFADLSHHLADLVLAIIGHDQFKADNSSRAR